MGVLQVGIESSLLRVQEMLTDECGFQFDDLKSKTLHESVLDRMNTVNIGSHSEYVDYLQHHPNGAAELQILIDSTTVNETNFFRHPGQMDALRTVIVPEIVDRKLRSGELTDPILSAWSAGCSTGDETYSIAIQIREALDPFYANNVEILGTDIDERVLSQAMLGNYRDKTTQYVGKRRLKAYFNEAAKGHEVNDALRSMVEFKKHNLIKTPYPSARWGKWDVIFCRNVIIYFDKATANKVIMNLHNSLAVGGYLVLGYSESLGARFDDLVLCECEDAFIYRKDNKNKKRPEQTRRSGSRKLNKSEPGLRRDRLVQQIDRHLNKDEYDKANEKIAALLKAEPNDPTAHVLSARIHFETGDHDKAADAAMRAIELDPLRAHAYFVMGVVSKIKGDQESAIRYLRRSVYLDDTLAMAYFHLGSIYKRQGKREDALREFRNTIVLLEKVTTNTKVEFTGGVQVRSILEVCRRDMEIM